jgi:hypothetical protein
MPMVILMGTKFHLEFSEKLTTLCVEKLRSVWPELPLSLKNPEEERLLLRARRQG